tara:strand:- start:469 stop:678 length:210 start_codon:yes stop_codon:yes gene_type:complete
MTQEEAQEFLARTIVRYTENGETVNAFKSEDDADLCVLAPDLSCVHYPGSGTVIEQLTVQQIVDIANGG